MNLAEQRYAEAIESRYVGAYRAAIEDMLVAIATENWPALSWSRERLERVITDSMGVGEVLGALGVLRTAAGAIVEEGMAMRGDRDGLIAFRQSDEPLTLPRVTLSEAVDDMVLRTPVVLQNAAARTAAQISELYASGHVVAFARSAEQAVTERVQALIAQALQEGTSEAEAVPRIRLEVDRVRKETQAWTDAYTQTAFRTNVNTAVTAGRFRQAQDPDVKAVAPCLRFEAVGDSDTRPNHEAADGTVMRSDNPAWNRIAPPLGYNCRCHVAMVTLPMLRRMGRIAADGSINEDQVPSGAFPDPGFRHEGLGVR